MTICAAFLITGLEYLTNTYNYQYKHVHVLPHQYKFHLVGYLSFFQTEHFF